VVDTLAIGSAGRLGRKLVEVRQKFRRDVARMAKKLKMQQELRVMPTRRSLTGYLLLPLERRGHVRLVLQLPSTDERGDLRVGQSTIMRLKCG
jgi:hypothetical protein